MLLSLSKHIKLIPVILLLFALFTLPAFSINNINFEQLFEEHGSIMLIVDPDSGEIVYANAVASDFYGYSKEELLSMNINQINTLTAEEIAAEMALARSEQRNFFIFEHLKKNGTTAIVEVKTYPSEINNRPVLFSIITDATQEMALQKRLQRKDQSIIWGLSLGFGLMGLLAYSSRSNYVKQRKHLALVEESEQKFKRYVENAPDGISVVNGQGKILDVNQPLLKMTGYNKEELLTMSSYHLTDPDNAPILEQGFEKLIEEGFLEIEYEIIRKDGQRSVWQIRRAKLEDDRYIGFIKDITELKEYQNKLIEAKEKAEEAALLKSRFLANMSHEIRTPMNGILGFLQILEQETQNHDQKESFHKIRLSAENLLGLINNILDFSKFESGGFTLTHSTFNLREVLFESISLYQKQAEQKGLLLLVSIDQNVPEFVIGDQFRVVQIINNLLSNAIKFTNQGRIRLRVKSQTKNMISIIIEDTGIGISSKGLGNIFESFIQEDSSTTRKYGGTGLGLPIVKHLVEMMDGSIHIDSLKDSWTRVNLIVYLPHNENAYVVHDEKLQFTADVKLTEDVSILVVEDDPISAAILNRMLSLHNFQTDHAENGAIALDLFNKNKYDLIFMDCQMPVMDGYEATTKIRESEVLHGLEKTPIVAITAHALQGDAQKAYESGMNGYLTKPVNLQHILETISQYVSVESKTPLQ